MKRVIEGRLYDTSTATAALVQTSDDEHFIEHRLTVYRTSGGAWFSVDEWTDNEGVDRVSFEAVDDDDVLSFLRGGNENEILDEDLIPPPPEATAEGIKEDREEASTTAAIYTRVPVELKYRVDRAARKAGMSMNKFMTTMIERHLPAERDA